MLKAFVLFIVKLTFNFLATRKVKDCYDQEFLASDLDSDYQISRKLGY